MERRATFAEILAEAKAQPSTSPDAQVYPGGHNAAGDLFDPAGNQLLYVGMLTPKQARQHVRDGAQLAWEEDGLGGGTGCQPVWIDEDVRDELSVGAKPDFVSEPCVEPWIDLWQGDGGAVVYAHGEVVWADAMT